MGKILWILIAVVCVIISKVDILGYYKGVVFMARSIKDCTESGYLEAAKSFDPNDLNVDVTGRSFVVTGANSGIGKATSLALAKKGGTIHMVCRNKESAENVKKEIVYETGNANIIVHIVDLSKMFEIYKFVADFALKYGKLDVLINNAGAILNTSRTITPDGFELSFATNTMSYYTLTTEMLPLLRKSSKPRIIIVSSAALLLQKLNSDDPQLKNVDAFSGLNSYQQNKRQQVVMGDELGKLNPDIHIFSMHPGWADTPGVRKSLPDFYQAFQGKLRTQDQGADTVVWLAISEAALSYESGLLFLDRNPITLHLPFAGTEETSSDREKFMTTLAEIYEKLKPTLEQPTETTIPAN